MSTRRFFLLLLGIAGLVGVMLPTVQRLRLGTNPGTSERTAAQPPSTGASTPAPGRGASQAPPAGAAAPSPSLPPAGGTAPPAPSVRPVGAAAPPATLLPSPASAAPPSPSDDAGVRPRFPIDKDGIRDAVRAGLPGMRECYEAWLRFQPGLAGRLKVTFTIDTDDGEDGKVEQVALERGDAGSNVNHAALEGCILQVFEDLRFEAPLNGPINVTYPVTLAQATDAGNPR